LIARYGFDEEDERGDGEDVVVGGEGGEPGDLEVADPHYEDGDVDGKKPDHEDKKGVSIVEE